MSMNKNEKLAQDLMGMEGTGKSFTVNGKDANDMLLEEQATNLMKVLVRLMISLRNIIKH